MKTLKALEPGFTVHRATQSSKFIWNMNDEELTELKKTQMKIFKTAEEAVHSDNYDLIILDEIMAAMTTGLVEKSEVVNLIMNKPERLEMVLTGRDVPLEIFDVADYVSEIEPLKHPINFGIAARKGIEF